MRRFVIGMVLIVTGCASTGDINAFKLNKPPVIYQGYSFEEMSAGGRWSDRTKINESIYLWVYLSDLKSINTDVKDGRSKFDVTFLLQKKNYLYNITMRADCLTDSHQVMNTINITAPVPSYEGYKGMMNVGEITASEIGYIVINDDKYDFTQPLGIQQESAAWHIKKMVCH